MAELGTVAMYEALAAVLAADSEWEALGKPLDYSMLHVYADPLDRRVHLRFDAGRLTEIRAANHHDDQIEVDYMLSGSPEVWRRVFSKIPGTRASGFHLALSTGQLRTTGPFMQAYLKHSRAWERLLDLVSLHGVVDPAPPS